MGKAGGGRRSERKGVSSRRCGWESEVWMGIRSYES